MFNPRSLKIALILAIATLLAAGSDKAPEYKGDGPKMEFVRIPAGSFHMGSPPSEKDREDDEGPVHKVHITKSFYMGKYEVTQAQWKTVMGTTLTQQRNKTDSPWHLKGEGPEHPMYYVSWEDATKFCKRLGRKFRLPTEAEWEYACRAGSRTRFHYGDDPNYSQFDQYAWYFDNSDNKTQPVGQKNPNEWYLCDMYGNVSEWCSDLYMFGGNYKNAGSVDPTGPSSAKVQLRIYRGGNWLEKPNRCRSANREVSIKSAGCDLIGFRVVYTGRDDGKDVLEMALPEKADAAVSISAKESENRPQAIAGVVRDDSGAPIDDVHIQIIPIQGWILRYYAQGRFEICWCPSDPNALMQGYHFLANNEQRNLAVGVEIVKDTKSLDVKLKLVSEQV